MNFEKFEKAPDAILKDVTDAPATDAATATPSENSAFKNTATIEDVFKANSNTKISPLNIADGATTPPIAGQAIQTPGNSVSLGGMLEAKLAIELMDAILPSLFIAMLYAVDVKLRKSELQLTEKEKGVIAPVMQQCLNSIMLNFNSPWTTLAVTIGVIYGSKITEKGVVNWIDKLNEKKEREALEEKTGLKVAPVAPVVPIKNDANATFNKFVAVSNDTPFPNVLQDAKKSAPYGEQEIKAMMKMRSIGRDRAIKALNKKYKIA